MRNKPSQIYPLGKTPEAFSPIGRRIAQLAVKQKLTPSPSARLLAVMPKKMKLKSPTEEFISKILELYSKENELNENLLKLFKTLYRPKIG